MPKAMNLRESKKRYMGRFFGSNGKKNGIAILLPQNKIKIKKINKK